MIPFDKVHLVTYGDHRYSRRREDFKREAEFFGFKRVSVNSFETLPSSFLESCGDFIRSNPRGGGYWIWKSCVVREALRDAKDGEFVFYADSGCTINPGGRNRFYEWIEICNAEKVLSFQMHHLPEKEWTKRSLASHMNCDNEEVMGSGQIMATSFGLKKCNETVDLIEEWFKICCLLWTIDDSKSSIENYPEFKDHRHDQSVFSLLRKRAGFHTIKDETYPDNHSWDGDKILSVPILATRRTY